MVQIFWFSVLCQTIYKCFTCINLPPFQEGLPLMTLHFLFMYFSEGAASFDSLLDTPHQTRIIELLIIHVEVGMHSFVKFCKICFCSDKLQEFKLLYK